MIAWFTYPSNEARYFRFPRSPYRGNVDDCVCLCLLSPRDWFAIRFLTNSICTQESINSVGSTKPTSPSSVEEIRVAIKKQIYKHFEDLRKCTINLIKLLEVTIIGSKLILAIDRWKLFNRTRMPIKSRRNGHQNTITKKWVTFNWTKVNFPMTHSDYKNCHIG